jgi:hypothetical protein
VQCLASVPFLPCWSEPFVINVLPLKSQIKNLVSCSPPRQGAFKLKIYFCARGVVSPLLANVYLHYVFDLWVDVWRRRVAKGDGIVVRYADDLVMGFQQRADAVQFLEQFKERLARFSLELHPDKTRLIEFGHYAARDRTQRGECHGVKCERPLNDICA